MLKWLITFLLICPTMVQGEQSSLWTQFIEASKNGSEPVLPDFSFAGYRYSEVSIPVVDHKRFDVRDFGAVADDGKSDKQSIIAAIRAAEKNGSGIVYFPLGRFDINTADDELEPIEIRGSNIVFRGEGADKSTLYFERDLPPRNPKKLYSSPYAIATLVEDKGDVITRVTSNARRETREIIVEDASGIESGDWVVLEVLSNSPDLIDYELGTLTPEPAWTRLLEEGVRVNERHQVSAVDGNRVSFFEPIHYDLNAAHGWHIRSFPHLEEVGFENLTFEGGWQSEFVHHRSARDDGGWSILKLSRVVNSWIKDVVFRDVSRPASISASAATTVLNARIEGHVGHHAISASGGSTGVLIAASEDSAGMWHSFGVGGGSTAGTVIWRSSFAAHTSFESHASQPRTTLFDNVSGGFFPGRAGGAVKNLPNHGMHLVLWNFKEIDGPDQDFRFVAPDSKYWRFVPPIVVGFHGAGTTFHSGQVGVIESLGEPARPESLFEAQLKHRLGALPDWMLKIRRSLKDK